MVFFFSVFKKMKKKAEETKWEWFYGFFRKQNTEKVFTCKNHKNIAIYWSGNEVCPFCVCWLANERLVKRIRKLEKKVGKKKVEKDEIPF
jgi:hypothetical protein